MTPDVIMQTDFGIGNCPRKRGCCKASPDHAGRGGRPLVAKEISASGSTVMTVREAGRRGGLSCLRNQGRAFFIEIGKKGQLEMRRKHPNMGAKWGKMGGRPRKPTLHQIMGGERQIK